MKKIVILFTLITILIASCQKDDFCVDPITPHLIIRFYDNANPDNYKKVTDLKVWAEGKEILENYDDVSTDSLAIQLDPAQDFTIYYLSSSTSNDTIRINYLKNDIYVSRSCGYKYNFTELELSNVTNNWIKDTEITNQTVENETEHIKILH